MSDDDLHDIYDVADRGDLEGPTTATAAPSTPQERERGVTFDRMAGMGTPGLAGGQQQKSPGHAILEKELAAAEAVDWIRRLDFFKAVKLDDRLYKRRGLVIAHIILSVLLVLAVGGYSGFAWYDWANRPEIAAGYTLQRSVKMSANDSLYLPSWACGQFCEVAFSQDYTSVPGCAFVKRTIATGSAANVCFAPDQDRGVFATVTKMNFPTGTLNFVIGGEITPITVVRGQRKTLVIGLKYEEAAPDPLLANPVTMPLAIQTRPISYIQRQQYEYSLDPALDKTGELRITLANNVEVELKARPGHPLVVLAQTGGAAVLAWIVLAFIPVIWHAFLQGTGQDSGSNVLEMAKMGMAGMGMDVVVVDREADITAMRKRRLMRSSSRLQMLEDRDKEEMLALQEQTLESDAAKVTASLQSFAKRNKAIIAINRFRVGVDKRLLKAPWFLWSSFAFYVALAVVIGIAVDSDQSSPFQILWMILEYILLGIIAVDFLVRLIVKAHKFFISAYELMGLVFLILAFAINPSIGVFLLFRVAPPFKDIASRYRPLLPLVRVLETLGKAVPAIIAAFCMLFIDLYAFAVVGVATFRSTGPPFQSTWTAFIALFLWPFTGSFTASGELVTGKGLSDEVRWYFFGYAAITAFVVMNLFLVALIDALHHVRDKYAVKKTEEKGDEEAEERRKEAESIRQLQNQLANKIDMLSTAIKKRGEKKEEPVEQRVVVEGAVATSDVVPRVAAAPGGMTPPVMPETQMRQAMSEVSREMKKDVSNVRADVNTVLDELRFLRTYVGTCLYGEDEAKSSDSRKRPVILEEIRLILHQIGDVHREIKEEDEAGQERLSGLLKELRGIRSKLGTIESSIQNEDIAL